ncbi:MAG: guanylate kinase [Geobacteraceae bacterium]|nr:guanylate kinase [Geobacteraceae bacterium]
MKQEGLLYIVSAPSGAGKTSLCNELIDIFPNLRHSVSYTTRLPRPGEKHGVDYFFVSREEFDRMSAAGEFAEFAEVHGNFYGTAVRTLEEYRSQGIHVILDIDCQGARQLKSCYRDAVYIFILPPNFSELRKRLEGRNSDAPDVIERRMRVAMDEVRESSWYDYLVVNDIFAQALDKLKSILIAEQCRTERVKRTVCGTFTIA